MTPFLQYIAEYVFEHHAIDTEHLCIILPNKNDKNIIMNKVGISFAIHKNIFEKKNIFLKIIQKKIIIF